MERTENGEDDKKLTANVSKLAGYLIDDNIFWLNIHRTAVGISCQVTY